MASGIEKQVSQHLECAVCLERMKEPKVLTCQHTYCSKCLEGLLNRDGRRRDVFKIKCPECRKTTEVSGGEVKNLPNNLLVKKILSELDCSPPSTKIPPCEKHEDEVLKLFCKDCDQLICRDCILIDHRDHHYKFVKDIYPAAKKKVEKVVDKAEEKINDLEAMVEKFDWLDTRAQESYQDASLEVDAFIDKHVAVLEKARKRMKGDLQKLYRNDNESRLKQRDALSASLQNLRKDVEFAKQTLKKGPPAEVLGTKKEIVERIGKVHTRDSARPNLITYHLEVAAPLNTENVVKKMAKVKRQVKECDADGEGDIFGGNDGAGYDEYEDYDGDVNESDMSEVSDLDDFEDDYEDEDDGLFGDCHVDDHGDCEVWDSVDELF